MIASRSRRRRAAEAGSGQALFGALTSTVGLLRWVMLGLVAIYACSGITRVAPHEDALVYRFGRLQRTLHPPGLLFALPAPIDRVVTVPSRKQQEMELDAWVTSTTTSEEPAAPSVASGSTMPEKLNPAMLAALPGDPRKTSASGSPASWLSARGLHPFFDGYTLTGDANIVRALFGVRYRIADPFAFVAAAQPEARNPLITGVIYDAAARTLAAMKIDQALGAGLESFRTQVRESAQQRLDALSLGVELTAFEVHEIMPPKPTNDAFAEVTSAKVEARTTVEQANTHRAQTLPKAASDAYRTRQQADAEARQLVARAAGSATSFTRLLAEHRLAPGLVETRLRAETLEEILPKVKTQTVLPSGDGPLNLFLRDTK